MIAVRSNHSTILLFAVAVLAGCGTQAIENSIPPAIVMTNVPDTGLPHHKTFTYTGKLQSFVVPAHVTSLNVDVRGAAGGGEMCTGTCYGNKDYFGRGGRIFAIIPVRPHEELYVFVGGKGTSRSGGFNGGGSSGPDSGSSRRSQGNYGGGGGSDIRRDLGRSTRLVVAAGGGGEGTSTTETGGNGGGNVGDAGGNYCYSAECGGNGGGGGGGSQTAGGVGGAAGNLGFGAGQPGAAGSSARGGDGGAGGCFSFTYSSKCTCGYASGCPGGGGGGGYYGGGGGGGGGAKPNAESYSSFGGGGAGGSSWAYSRAIGVKTWSGWKAAAGNGLVVINWR